MYKEYLLSTNKDDQKEYIETVLSQTEDNPKVAANIWGQEAVDYIVNNMKENFSNMKLKNILLQDCGCSKSINENIISLKTDKIFPRKPNIIKKNPL